MNVVFLGVLAEPDISIFIDLLMFLSVFGAAVLMLLALLDRAELTSRRHAATVKLILAPGPSALLEHGASLRPWELSCASSATRAPPRFPPFQSASFKPASSEVAASAVRLSADCDRD